MSSPARGEEPFTDEPSIQPDNAHGAPVDIEDPNIKSAHSAKKYDAGFARRRDKVLAVVVAALMLSVVGVAVVETFGSSDTFTPTPEIPPDADHAYPEYFGKSIIVPYDGEYSDSRFILTSAFCSGSLNFIVNDDKSVTISLNENVASSYDDYVWIIVDNRCKKTLISTPSDDPYLSWTPRYGDYTLTLQCKNGYGITTYSANIIHTCEVTKTYDWTYMEYDYHIEASFDYVKEFDKYDDFGHHISAARAVKDFNMSVNYVVVSDTIAEIGDRLISLYQETYGSMVPLDDQAFASFILGFVQLEFTYKTDQILYGQEEYFAYPMEVIFYGAGDCEDTSALCAAIFEYCGYSSAVCIVPGHAVAGVALENFESNNNTRTGYELMSQKINGKTYYACETTTSSLVDIGLVPAKGYGGFSYSYWIEKFPAKYGFKVVM